MDNNIDKKWPLFTPELTKFLSWVSVKRAGCGGGGGRGEVSSTLQGDVLCRLEKAPILIYPNGLFTRFYTEKLRLVPGRKAFFFIAQLIFVRF